jgi:hypothetical protein
LKQQRERERERERKREGGEREGKKRSNLASWRLKCTIVAFFAEWNMFGSSGRARCTVKIHAIAG